MHIKLMCTYTVLYIHLNSDAGLILKPGIVLPHPAQIDNSSDS